MKVRADSRLHQLTDDQQAQVYDWLVTLGYAKTKERLSLPPPDGFQLNVHLSSLHTFYMRYAAARDAELTSETEQTDAPAVSRLFPLTERAAHSGAFRLASSPIDPDNFSELSQWVSSQQLNHLKRDYLKIAEQAMDLSRKRMTIAEQRLALDREKFQFNAARSALEHLQELREVLNSPETDDEDKINRARSILFGVALNNQPK